MTDLFVNRYRIERELGRGSFGTVFLAHDAHLEDRPVALKVLHPALNADPVTVQRFRREAGILAHLSHMHIVPVFDGGVEEGTRFLVMKYVEGRNLAELIQTEGAQAPTRVLAWLGQMANALDYAHGQSVLHRDLKPSNLLLDEENDQIMITDFGLARAVESSGGSSVMRSQELLTGTASYMSPEVITGEAQGVATDLYSLGCVLYSLLSGYPPFVAKDAMAVLYQHVHAPVPDLDMKDELGQQLAIQIKSLLAKDPGKRPASATSVYKKVIDEMKAMETLSVAKSSPDPIIIEDEPSQEENMEVEAFTDESERQAIDNTEIVDTIEKDADTEISQIQEDVNDRPAPPKTVGIMGNDRLKLEDRMHHFRESISSRWIIAAGVLLTAVVIVVLWRALSGGPGPIPTPSLIPTSISAISPTPGPTTVPKTPTPEPATTTVPEVKNPANITSLVEHLPAEIMRIGRGVVVDVVFSDGAESAALITDVGVWLYSLGDPGNETLLTQHPGTTSAAWLGNNESIALGFSDGSIQIWNLDEQALMKVFDQQAASVTDLNARVDSSQLAVGYKDGIVRVWGSDSGELLHSLARSETAITDLDWSPDGSSLAAASSDGAVRIWNLDETGSTNDDTSEVEDGVPASIVLEGQGDSITTIKWSPDGRRIASASDNGAIRVRMAGNGYELSTMNGHHGLVTSLIWTQNGEWVISGGADRTLRFWHANTGNALQVYEGVEGAIRQIAWNSEQDGIITYSDQEVWEWQLPDVDILAIDLQFETSPSSLAWSPEGDQLALGFEDGKVMLWGAADEDPIRDFQIISDTVTSLAWSPEGTRLAAGSQDGTATIWEIDSSEQTSSTIISGTIELDYPVRQIAWEDQNTLVTLEHIEDQDYVSKYQVGHSSTNRFMIWERGRIEYDGVKSLFNISDDSVDFLYEYNESELERYSDRNIGGAQYRLPEKLRGHITQANISTDGSSVLVLADDGTISVIDSDGVVQYTPAPTSGDITAYAWSPVHPLIITGTDNGVLQSWNAVSGAFMQTFPIHSSAITHLVWSKDGTQLAVLVEDGMVQILGRQGGPALQEIPYQLNSQLATLLTELKGHSDWIRSLAWSPNGSWLASASDDNTIRVWDEEEGKLIYDLKGHTGPVRDLVWSPSGDRIASVAADRTLRVWELSDSGLLYTAKQHAESVASVDWSPDSNWIVTGSDDGTVRIWDAGGGDLLKTYSPHSLDVIGVTWSRDGSNIASAGDDQIVNLYSTNVISNTFAISSRTTITDTRTVLQTIRWSPDSKSLAVAGSDAVLIWDRASKEIVAGQGEVSQLTDMTWSPSGAQLAYSADDGLVNFWNAANSFNMTSVLNQPESILSIAMSPEGARLATGGTDNIVRIWDLTQGQPLFSLQGHYPRLTAVAWSPGGNEVATSGFDGRVRIWDSGAGQLLQELKGPTLNVMSIAWSPDGKRLAGGASDGTLWLWDTNTGENLLSMFLEMSPITDVAWSSDGNRIAASYRDGMVRVWNTETGKSMLELVGHSGLATSIAWSPDDTILASGSEDMTVRIWDAITGDPLLVMSGHTEKVNSLSWRGDGRELASGSADGSIIIWDPEDARPLRTLTGAQQGGEVITVDWTKTGSQLASTSSGGYVFIIDADTGRVETELRSDATSMTDVAWSPTDQNVLATTSQGGTLSIWDLGQKRP